MNFKVGDLVVNNSHRSHVRRLFKVIEALGNHCYTLRSVDGRFTCNKWDFGGRLDEASPLELLADCAE